MMQNSKSGRVLGSRWGPAPGRLAHRCYACATPLAPHTCIPTLGNECEEQVVCGVVHGALLVDGVVSVPPFPGHQLGTSL